MTFTKKRTSFIESKYYINMDSITKQNHMKDLGITFESTLTFKKHIANIATQSNFIYILLYRITKELKHPSLMKKLISTYLNPIVEYGAVIWSMNNEYENLEKSLKKATRYIIHSPFNHNDPSYIHYYDRLHSLDMLSFVQRRKIYFIILIIRILRDEIFTQFNGIIHRLREYTNQVTRSNEILRINHNLITKNSPLYFGIVNLNQYKSLFSMEDSINVIKIKLKRFFLHQGHA